MSRVVAVEAISADASTRLMTSEELQDICCRTDLPRVTYIQESFERELPAVAAAARLAPHLPARSLLLERAGGGRGTGEAAGRWRVRAALPAGAAGELRLWFAEDVLALARFPFLTPYNIRGKKNYVCHECGEQFEEPNPLKVHLFLSCKPFSAERFWEQLVRRVEQAERTSPPTWGAFPTFSAPLVPPLPEPVAGQLRAEALAAWWARSTAAVGASGRHRCLYCGKLYSRAYGLKIHVRTHTGYKPLRCPHCGRPFGDPSNLNKHVRLHVAAARSPHGSHVPHACARCGRGHARRRDLLRHLRAEHPARCAAAPASAPVLAHGNAAERNSPCATEPADTEL